MRTTFFAISAAVLFTSSTALADGACPQNMVDIGGVCVPQGCTIQSPGAKAGGAGLVVAALVAAGFVARRRR